MITHVTSYIQNKQNKKIKAQILIFNNKYVFKKIIIKLKYILRNTLVMYYALKDVPKE